MTTLGVLCACVLAASSGGSDADGLRPKRDLFGTARREPGHRPGAPSRVWGTVELSDGTRLQGWLSLTPGRPLEVFDLDSQEWREFAIHEIRGLRAAPRKEELEREWRWKEYGKDEKVYTGRSYPKRWLDHELVLRAESEKDEKGGERIRCHVKGAVLHLTTEPDRTAGGKAASVKTTPGEKEADAKKPAQEKSAEKKAARKKPGAKPAPKRLRFILRQYERGRLGQTLERLVYVKLVIVHEKVPSLKPAAGNGKRAAAE